MRNGSRLLSIVLFLLLILGPMQSVECQRIKALLLGAVNGATELEVIFTEEPLIEFTIVPSRDSAVKGGMTEMIKYIRQYFPRTYEGMSSFDYIFLAAPEYYLFTTKQDRWIHDAILDGAGGFNDGSVFSIVAQIHNSWANSLAQEAFPNDAPAVVARGAGGESPGMYYNVRIERDFPDPVLTPFLPYGVEDQIGAVSRYIIPREGSGTMAYQAGNFPGRGYIPYLVVWDYGQGRTMTCGGFLGGGGWILGEDMPYGPDMVMNLVFYSTRRNLIEDVEVFHQLKGSFRDFRNRLEYLNSLMDFIDRFGANIDSIQDDIWELRDTGSLARERYLEQDFVGAQDALNDASGLFRQAEAAAKRIKDSALWWVYAVEWMATSSVLFLSLFTLWTLMVRRRLYKQVSSTKMSREGSLE